MSGERRRFLVGLLLALLAIKFVVLPWVESQGDAREQLDILTQRLDRSTGVVLNRRAITASLSALEKANTSDRGRFPESANVESFRLEAQQRVTSIVQSQTLQLEAFDWVLEELPRESNLGFVRGRMTVRGDMRAVASLLGTMEGELPNMVVREVSYNMESPALGPHGHRAIMTQVADFYFRAKVPR